MYPNLRKGGYYSSAMPEDGSVDTYQYDPNGNQTCRTENGTRYNQVYDAENRLITVQILKSGVECPSNYTEAGPKKYNAMTRFYYDGQGNQVKRENYNGTTKVDSTLTYFGMYEVRYNSSGGQTGTTTYYPAAGAMRVTGTPNPGLYYILSDHLGSTSVVVNASGTVVGTQGYYPYGETRYSTNTIITDRLFTGQQQIASLGLYFYKARFYDSTLGRFLSADTDVPASQGVQGLNRYSYTNNSPINYTDPTGHVASKCGTFGEGCGDYTDEGRQDFLFSLVFEGSGENGVWLASDWDVYFANRTYYWNNPSKWIHPDPIGLAGWENHVLRLSSHYGNDDREEFVRDFALLFGGIPSSVPWVTAAFSVSGGPHDLLFLNESPDGLDQVFLQGTENQSHHYAGLFFMGYYTSPVGGNIVDFIRDGNAINGITIPDIYLGNIAARDGWNLRTGRISPVDMPGIIANLSIYNGLFNWGTYYRVP
jgi:RHS repeat-associated protein